MALVRGKYGIEFIQPPPNESSGGVGWLVAIVILAALSSLAWTIYGRIRNAREEAREGVEMLASLPPPHQPVSVDPTPKTPLEPPPPELKEVQKTLLQRPVKLRNLLMRLEEAEKRQDVEMAVTTIEQIRALPGELAADLDDTLARRLGQLNMRRLFDIKCAQWVDEVEVKRGDSATRIAYEHGSTLASLAKLNGGNVDKVILGQKLKVLNHPRFNLVVHKRSKTADLQLNGKFFKRYDIISPVLGDAGPYETTAKMKKFWAAIGTQFAPNDRAELELLMPTGTSVLVSEL